MSSALDEALQVLKYGFKQSSVVVVVVIVLLLVLFVLAVP